MTTTTTTKTRTTYKVEVLAADGWTVIAEAASKTTMMNRLNKLGTPAAIAEFGLCAARVITSAGKVVARLPEVGAFDVTLTEAQCKALAAERGEDFTPTEEDEAAAREAAVAAAKADTRVLPAKVQGEKRANVIGGLKRRTGTDSRGYAVIPGDEVKSKLGVGIVGAVGDDVASVAWAAGVSGPNEVPCRSLTVTARQGGNPVIVTDAVGTPILVGDRCKSPWSGRVGTIEALKANGEVSMRHDANNSKVNHPGPALLVIGHVDAPVVPQAAVSA